MSIRLKRLIIKALKYIIQTIVQSEFNIEGTEVEFSETGKYKYQKIYGDINDDLRAPLTNVKIIITASNSTNVNPFFFILSYFLKYLIFHFFLF